MWMSPSRGQSRPDPGIQWQLNLYGATFSFLEHQSKLCFQIVVLVSSNIMSWEYLSGFKTYAQGLSRARFDVLSVLSISKILRFAIRDYITTHCITVSDPSGQTVSNNPISNKVALPISDQKL